MSTSAPRSTVPYGEVVRIGVSLTSFHPGVAPATAVASTLERVEAAAAAGLDTLSFGDQHAVGPGQYLQAVPILARALALWPRDRSCGLLFLVPLWHPVVMAEMIGTLAAMSDRRFVVQIGIGGGAEQFRAMGADLRRRGRETDRRIALVDQLLAGASIDDPELGIGAASIGPIPSNGHEWWIGSGGAPAAIERAAVLGDALYLGPGWDRSEVADLVDRYRERCEVADRQPRIVLRRDLVLAERADDATSMADRVVAAGYRGMRRTVVVAGDPATVADEFTAFGELGVEEIAARVISVPQPEAVETIRLLGPVRAALG